jgi:hypothetical protein
LLKIELRGFLNYFVSFMVNTTLVNLDIWCEFAGGAGAAADAVHHRRAAAVQQLAQPPLPEAGSRAGHVPGGLQRGHVDHRDVRDQVAGRARRPLPLLRQRAVDHAEPHDAAAHHVLPLPLVRLPRRHLEVGLRARRKTLIRKSFPMYLLSLCILFFQIFKEVEVGAKKKYVCTRLIYIFAKMVSFF